MDLALARSPSPRRVLDVGCGTGYLLRRLAERCPATVGLAGLDAAAGMVRVAREATTDSRLSFLVGRAEQLPYPAGTFDLVVSATSFDHWADQQAGLAQCARVLAPGGCLVLADLFSAWLLPTLVGGRRHKARTRRRADHLLTAAGLRPVAWRRLYPFLQAVTADR